MPRFLDDAEQTKSFTFEEYRTNPYKHAKACATHNGQLRRGTVSEISRGVKSLELVYWIVFEDGIVEQCTHDEVEVALLKDVVLIISIRLDMSIRRWRVSLTS